MGTEPKRILLARIGALGDTLMALPVAQALKSRSPSPAVDLLCSASVAPLVDLCTQLDRVYPLQQRNVPYRLSREKQRLVKILKKQGYSQAVLMESAQHFFTILHETGIQEISSYLDFPFDPGLHSVENNLRLAGLEAWSEFPARIDLDLSSPSCQGFESDLEGLERPFVGIHPGYGPPRRRRGQTARLKGWPRASFIRLAQALQQRGASVIITGSSKDTRDARTIADRLDPKRTRMLAGKTTLPQLAGLIEQLDLLLSVDSGPAHLGAALGTSLVVLWGPAKWVQTRPLPTTSPLKLIRRNVPCSPCYDTPAMKSCRRNICMQSIRVESVFDTCCGVLDAASSGDWGWARS